MSKPRRGLWLSVTFLFCLPLRATSAIGGTAPQAGKLIQVQGQVAVLRAGALRLANPLYLSHTGPKIYLTWKQYFANFVLNQILGCSFALNLGVGWRRLDAKYERDIDFNTVDGLAKLVFRHKSGIRAYVSSLLVYQKQDDRESHLFALANSGLGYEFPNKQGEIFFNVNTFFNRHFTYRLEPIRLEPFFAARQITLRLSRYF